MKNAYTIAIHALVILCSQGIQAQPLIESSVNFPSGFNEDATTSLFTGPKLGSDALLACRLALIDTGEMV